MSIVVGGKIFATQIPFPFILLLNHTLQTFLSEFQMQQKNHTKTFYSATVMVKCQEMQTLGKSKIWMETHFYCF